MIEPKIQDCIMLLNFLDTPSGENDIIPVPNWTERNDGKPITNDSGNENDTNIIFNKRVTRPTRRSNLQDNIGISFEDDAFLD